jgi:major type 1 subunit fimbrin (pilin)
MYGPSINKKSPRVNWMNLKATLSALLFAGLAAPSAFAETGTITFTGDITNITCSVNGGTPTGGENFTVNIGSVNASDFAAVGDTSGKTGFRIYIGKTGETGCPDGTKVWARFEPGSTVDPTSGELVTTGGATGVRIRLFDKNDNKIDVWSDAQDGIKETVANNQAVLPYSASYVRTADLTAGAANSSVLYTVRYEAATP